jgi:hypothetical protein
MSSLPTNSATPRSSAPRCDRDKLPALAEAVARREQQLEAVVGAALGWRRETTLEDDDGGRT